MTIIMVQDRTYKFKCVICARVVNLRLRRGRKWLALPSCMGGIPPHPASMLVAEDYDLYREMYDLFEKGVTLSKPIINTRNYRRFRIEPYGERRQDIGTLGGR